MTCRDVQSRLELLALDGLESAEAGEIRRHVAGCAACAASEAEIRGLMRRLDGHLSSPRADAGLAGRIIAGTRPARRTGWRMAVAAAILVGVVGTILGLRGLRPPPALEGVRIAGSGYRVLEPRRIRLELGELRVKVDPSAAAFVIETPAGDVKALGTEFFVSSMGGDMGRLMTSVIVLAGLVQLSNGQGAVSASGGESISAQEGAAPQKQVENLAAKFGSFFEPVPVKAVPSIPAYDLPIDPARISNWSEMANKLGLAEGEPLLLKNGFVVVPLPKGWERDDIIKPYDTLKKIEAPIFVTADTLLHLYHVQFDESLKDIEELEFHPDLVAMIERLERRSAELHAGADDAMKEPLLKAWTFLSIGLKALKPEFTPAAATAAEVARVLDKIDAHAGMWPGPQTAADEWPLFRYAEDFSQYVPRGHYTRSETLKRYFRGMMWFGRMTFLLKGGEPYGPDDQPFLVSGQEGRDQTIAAAWITRLLAAETLEDGRSARDIWERIYAVTSFYVGLSDDLGFEEYRDALTKVTGAAMNVGLLSAPETRRALQAELAKFGAPAIYSGTGNLGTADTSNDPGKRVEGLGKTTGFRFMGQRFIPDSYLLGRLVFPDVGKPVGRTDMFTCVQTAGGPARGFPRGLDVMALMGSKRAAAILHELGDDAYGRNDTGKDLKYTAVADGLRKEFASFKDRDWNRNLYWSWLWSLQPLLEEYGRGYPTFMTTEAWHDKSLTTALASWAQLRHDTILYAKQSWTPKSLGMDEPLKQVHGYVEPVPQFYARLLALTRMTMKGLGQMKVLSPQAVERLKGLETILARLLSISEREFAAQELDADDHQFIRHFAGSLQNIQVKYPDVERQLEEAYRKKDTKRASELEAQLSADRSMKTTIIADVHTDANTSQVLEEGTGHVRLAIVCVRQPDGSLGLCAGPVLSYYEFKHPMKDRLTDEAWTKMLDNGKAPADPEWVKSHVRK